MEVQSLYNKDLSLAPMNVEVHLVPGPPEIRILGLPDAATRESATRVKAAIRACGFEFPAARTVLVQLKPSSERKSSRGLDLAVAAGILWEMDQVPRPQEKWMLYGELSLTGEISTPRDFAVWSAEKNVEKVCTGADTQGVGPNHVGVTKLSDLMAPVILPAREAQPWVRPLPPKDLLFTKTAARLMQIISISDHSVLLAGPPGSGKTSTLESLTYIAPTPDISTADWLRRFHWMLHNEERNHRPVIAPHHSVSAVALVGGGQPPRPGEVTRAHGGFLLLDEFLEFSSAAIEALREPIQNGRVRIARGFEASEFPARFQLLATTNLCPCGRFVPGKQSGCVCGGRRVRNYLSRLNGPVLDRLDILAFTDEWAKENRNISGNEVIAGIDRALVYKKNLRAQFIKKSNGAEDPGTLDELIPFPVGLTQRLMGETESISWRRRNALRRVAQSIALLKGEQQVSGPTYCEALELSVSPFQRLLRALQC